MLSHASIAPTITALQTTGGTAAVHALRQRPDHTAASSVASVADDQIEQAVGTEQVSDQAAHGKTGDRRLAVAAGQHAQSLAQAELDRGKGETEEIGDPRERRVGGGNDGGAGEIAGRVLQLHRGILSWKCKQTQRKDGQAAPQDRLTLP